MDKKTLTTSSPELVDVIVPTYKETTRLVRAVKSAAGQSAFLKTIFVLDDGSPEETVSKIQIDLGKIAQVNFTALSHEGNPGVVRGIGLERSKAIWVAFLDADDYWEEEKLKTQVEFANSVGASMVFANAWMDSGLGGKSLFFQKNRMPRKLSTFSLLNQNYIINSSVIVKLECLEMIGGYARSEQVLAVEDYATWLRLSCICKGVGIQEPLLTYTVTDNSFSRVNADKSPISAIRDFRNWIHSSALPIQSKFYYAVLANSFIIYKTLRLLLSKAFSLRF
jgi:glycosyltransferase involved in cell wall biosynthesis